MSKHKIKIEFWDSQIDLIDKVIYDLEEHFEESGNMKLLTKIITLKHFLATVGLPVAV